jgi:hypothetical protein
MSYWIKLSLDILDDPKIAKLSDFQFRIFTLCLLFAKELDKDGQLAPAADIAWRLRLPEKPVSDALLAMKGVGIVDEHERGWNIVNFAKRQTVSDSTERVRAFRRRKKEKEDVTDVTVTPSSSVSSSPLDSDSYDSYEVKDLPPAAVAYSAYQNHNGGGRQAEKLYQQVTGQMSIPSLSQTQALTDLQTLLDHYGKNIERAVTEGKEIFGVWCNTAGKNGKPYSRTNTAWLGKWLEKIAPLPGDPHESSLQAILIKARKEQEAMQKR